MKPASALAQTRFITLASTTSTQNSGLFDVLLPAFTSATGIAVRVVAVGTGQAIRLAERGDADVLLVHDTRSEEQFVAKNHGIARHPMMHNDFVIVGPKSDPAGVRGGRDALAAFRAIATKEAPFASRGDDSGTHKAEKRLWAAVRIDPVGASGGWYRELGAGMGATLNTAAGMDAYALTDRGTWLSFKNRQDLVLVQEGDPALFNPYGVIVVNPAKHPHVKHADAGRFVEWLLSPVGQGVIATYKIAGEPLFFPNAIPNANR